MNLVRTSIAQLGIRAASPLAVMAGLYLLFAGHNQPGGGFAAGLVFGTVVALRTVTGLQKPEHGSLWTAFGVGLAVVTAAAPLVFGDSLLDQKIFEWTLPLLGKVKVGSALPFDIGVTAVVVGLVISLLDGLDVDELARPSRPQRSASRATASEETAP